MLLLLPSDFCFFFETGDDTFHRHRNVLGVGPPPLRTTSGAGLRTWSACDTMTKTLFGHRAECAPARRAGTRIPQVDMCPFCLVRACNSPFALIMCLHLFQFPGSLSTSWTAVRSSGSSMLNDSASALLESIARAVRSVFLRAARVLLCCCDFFFGYY